MAKTNEPRRSRRLLAQKPTKLSSAMKSQHPSRSSAARQVYPGINVRSSSASANRSSVDFGVVETKLNQRLRKHRQAAEDVVYAASKFVDDSASCSDFSSDGEESEDEDEFDELADLSTDYFEWSAAHDTDPSRHLSYDSRFEPGNEEYEYDDFVVGDDESVGSISSISEATEFSGLGLGSERRVSEGTADTRRSSGTESKLFYSDPDDVFNPLEFLSRSELDFVPGIPERDTELLVAEASEEIAEEIRDALAIFSRRCNRYRAPIRLRLAAAVLEDEEVKEALENAVRLGLGRKLSLADGSKRWTIGPKDA